MTRSEGSSQEKVLKTACSAHCSGRCLLRVRVKNGVVTAIETDNGEEPQFRACLKGRAYRQRVYHPDRLKYPLRRVGERGQGKFERISWDAALDAIASELKRVKETYGPGAILALISGGDTGLFNTGALLLRLLNLAGGHTATWGFFSYEGGIFASLASYGDLFTSSNRDDLLDSRFIILWGLNPAITIHSTGTMLYLIKAREAGSRVVSVDPRLTETAAIVADQWIPIRPSTDAAMLIAMAYVIIKENLQDQAYLDKYTVGFEHFKHYVIGDEDGIPKTPSWAEDITGVPASTIENLAREYATTKPAALIDGIAPGRTAYGEQYHRAAIALAAMTGNVGIHGGNAPGRSYCGMCGTFPFKLGPGPAAGPNPYETGAPPRPYSFPSYEKFRPGHTNSMRINRHHLADAMIKGKAGDHRENHKFLYMTKVNYVGQETNVNRAVQALRNMEFIVVHEQFMTATARFADIVLPICTILETYDICTGGSTPMYGYMKKVIEPLHESKSDFQIFTALAERLGITNYSDKTEEEWIRQMVETGGGIPDYETFKREGIYKVPLSEPYIAFKAQIEDPANNPFPTPSGKIEIRSQQMADWKNTEIPPIPKYIEPPEGPTDPLREKYPLQLITTHFNRRAHSVFENIPWLKELEPQAVKLHTSDAEARSIKDGDTVRVFNDRGAIIIPAKVTERIMPGVVDIPQGAWYDPDENGVDRGGCCNVLTKEGTSPGGAFITNTCLVQVTKT
ncbi:molybdopterin-dependent oxidoreductase [Chloroflexota bacterium]